MRDHAITTTARRTTRGWRITARSVVDGATVERSHTFLEEEGDTYHHAGVARALALEHALEGIWHRARLGDGFVFVPITGMNGDFTVGGWEAHDDPDAPWNW